MDCYLKLQEDRAVQRTKDILGPQTVIAAQLGLCPSSLNNYCNRNQSMPMYIAIGIELMTCEQDKEKKVSALELAGLLDSKETAILLKKAIKEAKHNQLIMDDLPILADQLYTFSYFGKRSAPFLKLKRYTLTEAANEAGLESLEQYYQIKQVKQYGHPSLVAAMRNKVIPIATAAKLSTLAWDEQANLMHLDTKTLTAALEALQINELTLESSLLQHMQTAGVLPQLDYLRLLRQDEDIPELRQAFNFSTRFAISFALIYFSGLRQGQRSDLSLRQNQVGLTPYFDEVNTFLNHLSEKNHCRLSTLEKIRAHITALEPIKEDVKVYLSAMQGRTDEFITQTLGIGNRQTYHQGRTVFLNATPELMEALDKQEISIFSAYQQIKAKQNPSLIINQTEESA